MPLVMLAIWAAAGAIGAGWPGTRSREFAAYYLARRCWCA